MKFYFDMTLVAENGRALGFFDGMREFNDIPTAREKSQLFGNNSSDLPLELRKYLEQVQVLENYIPLDKPDNNDMVGSCLFSFFYILTIDTKEIFISYFEKNYGLYFWDYSED